MEVNSAIVPYCVRLKPLYNYLVKRNNVKNPAPKTIDRILSNLLSEKESYDRYFTYCVSIITDILEIREDYRQRKRINVSVLLSKAYSPVLADSVRFNKEYIKKEQWEKIENELFRICDIMDTHLIEISTRRLLSYYSDLVA